LHKILRPCLIYAGLKFPFRKIENLGKLGNENCNGKKLNPLSYNRLLEELPFLLEKRYVHSLQYFFSSWSTTHARQVRIWSSSNQM
jgi:hypothetical protein